MPPRIESLEARRLLSAGQLDTSFGNGGHLVDEHVAVPITTDSTTQSTFGFPADRTAIQTDGKIVIAGEGDGSVYVERYLPDGSPDLTFNNGTGREVIAAGVSEYAYIGDLRILSDGRIEFTIANVVGRLLPSGALDPSLNPNSSQPGIEAIQAPVSAEYGVDAAATQSDGKFVFAYFESQQPDPTKPPVALQHFGRLNGDGSPDLSFGSGGIVTEPAGYATFGDESTYAMSVASDGTIAAAGEDYSGGNSRPAYLTLLDSSGKVISDQIIGDNEFSAATAVRPWFNNKFLVTVEDYDLTEYDLVAHDGTITSFQLVSVSDNAGPAADLRPRAFDAAGDIYAAGSIPSADGGSTDFAIARFTPSGHLDPTFGNNGLTRVSFGSTNNAATHYAGDLAFDASGNLIVAGSAGEHPALARLFNSVGAGETPDTTPPRAFLINGPATFSSPTRAIGITVEFIDDVNGFHDDDSTIQIIGPDGIARAGTIDYSFYGDFDHTGSRQSERFLFRAKKRHGKWSPADNGTYTVQLVGGHLSATAGNYAPTATLGTFNVNISRSRPALPAPARGARYGHAH